MKTYEDLTKSEKEKLMLFKMYSKPVSTIIMGLLLITIIIACLGVIVGVFASIWFGLAFFFLSLYLLICTTFLLQRIRKENFLIFGWKNTIEDVFEITPKDVKNVTIERKEIWRKK